MKQLSPQDKSLGAIYGFAAQDEAQLAEEQVARAYCAANGKVGSRDADGFSMCDADLDYIEFGFIKPILTDKDVAHIKAEEALQAKRAAQRAAKRAQMLAGMGFATLAP